MPPLHGRAARHRRPRLALRLLVLAELQDGRELLLRERHVVVEARHDDVRDADGGEDVREVGVEEVEHDHDLRAAVAKLELHLALRVERVVANDHGSEPRGCVVRHHVLRAVRHHESHPVAGPHPHRREHRRAPLRLTQRLGVRELASEPRDRRSVREPLRRALEHLEHRDIGIRREGLRDAGRVAREPGSVIGHGRIIPDRGRPSQTGLSCRGYAPQPWNGPNRCARARGEHSHRSRAR